jgi:DNA-directed RNA polymerase subunit beta
LSAVPERLSYGKLPEVLEVGNLIETQLNSFRWFLERGLRELFDEINPITDYTGKNYELRFLDYSFGEPKFDQEECRNRDMTFAAPLRIMTRLHIKTGENAGEIKEAEVYLGDFPMMTAEGTFLVNGTERVVVSQLVRSPGVYFTAGADNPATGRPLFAVKFIPNRGAWLEIETSTKDVLTAKIDRKRKFQATTLIRALGYPSDDDIRHFFRDVDTDPEHRYIDATLEKDPSHDVNEALIELYRKIRPGDPPTVENARNLLQALFFNPRRFDLGRVGRFKLDKRLGLSEAEARQRAEDKDLRVLAHEDFVNIMRRLIELNNGRGEADDIDHLGNRRVRAVGELLQNQFRTGLLRMERIIKERMTICDATTVTAASLINARPVVAAIKEFFGSSQLSQFMDQHNPLSELTHKRRLSALGPGGLSRERAGFDVRDVHFSHYGRICPIETPEGPNIGLMGSLATFARVNDFGFIETPLRRVVRSLSPAEDGERLLGRQLAEEVAGVKAGTRLKVADVERLVKGGAERVAITPWVSDEVLFLSADEEDKYTVAQANAPIAENGEFKVEHTPARTRHTFKDVPVGEVDFIDVSPKQTVSVATAMIPFLEHDDANRALMGSNMQRQAVPLVTTDSPVVGTGMEYYAAKDSGELIVAPTDGTVVGVHVPLAEVRSDLTKIVRSGQDSGLGILFRPDDGGPDVWYGVHKFVRSNQGTCLSQRIVVNPGDRVEKGVILADGPSTNLGELALGKNVLVAFMPWEGYNYEDAILISESVVRDDKYTSIHIEEFEVEVRDTKLGPEEVTRDLPNVSEESLRNLDERGIVYVGAEVQQGDILVGKTTPKGESELSAEERLLRAIFGEKAKEVRDSSLRVPHGERGVVVDIKHFSRAGKDELPAGVNELIRIYVAQKRKIAQGDKMAGRHGNKGVIARILPIEDLPFLPDGTPVEIVLNPLGVPSRMNLGQVLETHLGWAAAALGIKVATPVFDGASESQIEDELERAGLPRDGKTILRDGRTGEPFEKPITVGVIYMLKLAHLVEDKIHARSTGPYSLVTQQPLGGKAQFGGQRFGEMEVWALEAYGASHILQEILTIKSDDIVGRVKAYEAIVKGDNTLDAGVPESFRVLVKELEGLALGVEIMSENEEQIVFTEDDMPDMPLGLGINLERDERDDAEDLGR